MAADDEVTNPVLMISLAQYCQNMAIDALRALDLLVRDGEALNLPQTAHFPLLRTATESSAEMIWLLGPEHRRERVLRLLQAQAAELSHEGGLVHAMSAEDPGDGREERSRKNSYQKEFSKIRRRRMAELREVGHRLGIDPNEFQSHQMRYGPIVQEAAARIGGTPSIMRTQWHVVSGLTHPSSTRGMATSVIDQLEPLGAGVVSANMSTNLRLVNWSLLNAIRLYLAAQNLLLTRRGLLPPEDDSSP